MQADCSVCPAGNYCPIQTVRPIQCSAGTHRDTPGASHLGQCLLCLPGTFSLQVGRTTNCPLCEANFYCRTSTSKNVCPLHTTSSAGSYSRVNCICDPGYQCTYYKQIQAIVTLNATLWEFQNDYNGVRTAFLAAMAAAAGVQPSQITINNVVTQNRRRRLLSMGEEAERELIDVHASVHGAVVLRDLDKHLNRHMENLHISHTWKQAPQVRAVPVSSTVVAVRKDPPAAKAFRRENREPVAAAPDSKSYKDRAKARLVQLVNKDQLIDTLYKV